MSFYQEDDTNQKCLYNVRADTQQFNNHFLNWISALVKELGGYFFPYCKIHFYG